MQIAFWHNVNQNRCVHPKQPPFFAYVHFLAAVWPIHPSTCFWNVTYYSPFPAGIYLLKVNNRNTRTKCEICSKLTIKTPEQRQSFTLCSSVSIVNLEHVIAGWIMNSYTSQNRIQCLKRGTMRENETFIYHLFIEECLFVLPLIAWIIRDGYHFIMSSV